MDHFLRVATRTGKHAVGFKFQLVVHRMNGHLKDLNGCELVAVMHRGKKRVTTKSAIYQVSNNEVIWGDILPFASTLYQCKTGLFQNKPCSVHVYDARTDTLVGTFDFNLGEMVSVEKDSQKESMHVPAVKCQDPRASISITIISTRVHLKASSGDVSNADHEHSGFEDESFADSHSDISVGSHISKTSAASTAKRPSSNTITRIKCHTLTSSYTEHPIEYNPETGESKNPMIRDAAHVDQSSDHKHEELLQTIKELELKARKLEENNFKLENKIQLQKDDIEEAQAALEYAQASQEEKIKSLKEERDTLAAQLQVIASKGKVEIPDQNDREVELKKFRDENEMLKNRMRLLQAAVENRTAPTPIAHCNSTNEVEEDEDEVEDNAASDASSSSDDEEEFHQSSHDQSTALLTEIAQLKSQLDSVRDECKQLKDEKKFSQQESDETIQTLRSKIETLTITNEQFSKNYELRKKDSMSDITSLTLEDFAAPSSSSSSSFAALRTATTVAAGALMDQAYRDEERKEEEVESSGDEEEESPPSISRDSTEKIAALQKENELLVDQLQHMDEAVTRLMEEKGDLLLRMQLSPSSSGSSKSLNNKETEETIRKLRDQTRTDASTIESLRVQVDQNEKFKVQAEKAQEKIDELLLQLRLNERAKSIADQADCTIHELQEQLKEYANCKAEAEEAQSTIEELRHKVEQISQELSLTQKELEKIQSNSTSEIASTAAAAANATVKQKRLEDKIEELFNENEELKTRVNELEEALAEAETKNMSASTRTSQLEEELEREVEELRTDTKILRKELETLRKSHQATEDEVTIAI
jgi:hypothetical protein